MMIYMEIVFWRDRFKNLSLKQIFINFYLFNVATRKFKILYVWLTIYFFNSVLLHCISGRGNFIACLNRSIVGMLTTSHSGLFH
jgi:hypothetical protein